MGVRGWYRVLREEGYVPETEPCCTTSLWRASDGVMDNLTHLERIPPQSEILVDGNGLAFFWYRVAYARHVAGVIKQEKKNCRPPNGSPSSSCCVKLGKNGTKLSPTQVRRLLPNFLPLSQLSSVVNEFVRTLRNKHNMKVTVYWDGEKRRVYKCQTDRQRQARIPEERSNLRDYCETGILPPTATVCAWESLFPKNELYKRQIIHTLQGLQVPNVYCEEEADGVIARAASGNPRAYILGLDTDFCFFARVQYIPLNTLSAQGQAVTAVVLRRSEIADSLGLARESMMTELAILVGNDYIHPDQVELDYKGGKHVHEVLNFLRDQQSSFHVTSLSEDVEESLRFVRSLYDLEDLEEYPLQERESSVCDSEEDEAGDEILHLVPSPEDDLSGHRSLPRKVPLDLCVVNPLLDTSAKDAVLRCLEGYIERNSDRALVKPEHVDVLRKLPLDSSMAQLVRQGSWRPKVEDVSAACIVERLLYNVYSTPSAVTRLLPPFAVFDQHKFHALLRLERGEETPKSSNPLNALPSPDTNGKKKEKNKPEKVSLPIDEHQERILASIKKNRVTIIVGETGCGKSSRVPVMILRSPPPDPAFSKVKLFMSQPRRIAAKGLVERVRSVEPDFRDQIALRMGHGVREYERKTTRAWFVTTGYLVRLMANKIDALKDVSHLIIDEVHERSVDTDILCLLCRRLLRTNEHIRLVLMSATLAAHMYQEYFGAPEPPLIVGAKRYPVTEVFLDDLLAPSSKYKLPTKAKKAAQQVLDECNKMKCRRTPSVSYMDKLLSIVTNLVVAIAEAGSSVLIFVPGMNEIVLISELFENLYVPGKRFTCLPVHSDIPFEDQMKVFDSADDDECRVIIATNSAESSVTLPALNHVICLGLAKQITYNELSHRQMLEPVWISRASATQRAGRTGRIAPGTVFRLYSRECYSEHMTPFEPGEMVRVPLDSIILALKEMMADDEIVTNVLYDCIEPPDMRTIDRSYKSLHDSHFITCPDDSCDMTNLGRFALALGIDLSLGSLIGLGIQFGVGREALQMAAIFSFPKTPWQIPNPMLQSPNEFNEMVQRTYVSKCKFDAGLFSEPLSIMNLLWDFGQVSSGKKKQWCWKNGISHQRISRLASTVESVTQRVAKFLDISVDALSLDTAPRHMPHAKVVLLRVVQTWVFHDTMIQCKVKPTPESTAEVALLPHSDPVDETILDGIFVKDRHDYTLISNMEIEQTVRCTINIKTETEFSKLVETRVLSFATEKSIALVWIWLGTTFSVYIAKSLVEEADYSPIRDEIHDLLYTPGTIVGEERRKKVARGVGERNCGRWSFKIGPQSAQRPCFLQYTTPGRPPKKVVRQLRNLTSKMARFVGSYPRFTSLSVDASSCNPATISGSKILFAVVSRGSHARDVSAQDLKDMVGAAGEIVVKTRKKNGGTVLRFPVDAAKESTKDRKQVLLRNSPEAMRLLSVLASRRRTHNIIVEVDQVEEESSSKVLVEIFPEKKNTQLSYRWTRFNADDNVFVDVNSVVSSAFPIGWGGTLYCCCANALEIKGGALRAEGLTLLPLGRLFFLLSRISFGLLKGDANNEETLVKCLKWIAQDDGGGPAPVDAMRRLQKAAAFHNSFNAGEELACMPLNVETLLDILGGLNGQEAPLWDTFLQDPFLPENRRRLRLHM